MCIRDRYETFSPLEALKWERRTGVLETNADGTKSLDINMCKEPAYEQVSISYQQCNGHQQLIALKNRVDNAYNSKGPPVLAVGDSLVLPISAKYLLGGQGGVLLGWAKNKRKKNEKHLEYILDFNTLCESTNIWDSVCRVRADSSIQLFNPWTGGEFSAMDGCDVGQNAIGADEIDTRCVNSLECPQQDLSLIHI